MRERRVFVYLPFGDTHRRSVQLIASYFLTPTSVSLILFTIMVTKIRVRNIYSCEEVVKTIDRCENLYSEVYYDGLNPLTSLKDGSSLPNKTETSA